MSVRVCVYPVGDPGSISRYGSASGSVASGPVLRSSLVPAATMAALSRQGIDMSASTNQTPGTVVSTPMQRRMCSLPEIPSSPSARSVASSNSPLLIQVRSIAENQKHQLTQHGTARNSIFPNFRALQRLSLSAKTRTASKTVNRVLNENSTSPNQSRARTTLLRSAVGQTPGSGQDDQSLDEGMPAGFSALGSLPGNRRGDLERQASLSCNEIYAADHSVSPKVHKKRSAKKKQRKSKRTKSRAHHIQRQPKESRRSGSNKTAPPQENSLGALLCAVPVRVETKKIEVYSSRYSKCDAERAVSNQQERKPIDGEKGNSPKHTSACGDSPTGVAPMSKVAPPSRDPVIHASRVSPQLSGPSGLAAGSRDRDSVSRVTRVYLSEKQSGNLKECGVMLPCAPPATPTPDMLQRYQYIPSMMDLRSQRVVRDRLSGMEQKAKKRQQQQREEARKTEQQLQRDQTIAWKQRQRHEIYALNKIMTEFEEKNFQEFMKRMSGKTP